LSSIVAGGAVAAATAPPCLFESFSNCGANFWFELLLLGGCDSNCPAVFVPYFFFSYAFDLPGGAIFERASEPTFRLFWQYLRFSTPVFIGGRVA